jgi:hypothetical protein
MGIYVQCNCLNMYARWLLRFDLKSDRETGSPFFFFGGGSDKPLKGNGIVDIWHISAEDRRQGTSKVSGQGDQIGRSFPFWAIYIWHFLKIT